MNTTIKEELIYNKYNLTLLLFSLLTPLVAILSLNRLKYDLSGEIVFNPSWRVLFEHLLAGIYLPLLFLFLTITIWWGIERITSFIIKQDLRTINDKLILKCLKIVTIIALLFEAFFQWNLQPNVFSNVQMLEFASGTLLLWIYVLKVFKK